MPDRYRRIGNLVGAFDATLIDRVAQQHLLPHGLQCRDSSLIVQVQMQEQVAQRGADVHRVLHQKTNQPEAGRSRALPGQQTEVRAPGRRGAQREKTARRGKGDDVVGLVEDASLQSGERQNLDRIAALFDQQLGHSEQRRDAHRALADRGGRNGCSRDGGGRGGLRY